MGHYFTRRPTPHTTTLFPTNLSPVTHTTEPAASITLFQPSMNWAPSFRARIRYLPCMNWVPSVHELGTLRARKDTIVWIRARSGHFLCSDGNISLTRARFGVFLCPKPLFWCIPCTFRVLFVLRRPHFSHSRTFWCVFVPETSLLVHSEHV